MVNPLCTDGDWDHFACNWHTKIKLVQERESDEWKWIPFDLLVWRLMWWDSSGLYATEQRHSVILITSLLTCILTCCGSICSLWCSSFIRHIASLIYFTFFGICALLLCFIALTLCYSCSSVVIHSPTVKLAKLSLANILSAWASAVLSTKILPGVKAGCSPSGEANSPLPLSLQKWLF